LTVEGIGGNSFRKNGGKTIFDISDLASVGVGSAFKTLKTMRMALAEIKVGIAENKYDAVILIDFPDFNMKVAEAADAVGIPVIYYVCPQFWAWRSYRINKIKKWVDMMIVVLPFEEDFYNGKGVFTRFLGHPLLDEMPEKTERKELRERYNINDNNILLGAMPGSRRGEVERMFPLMLDAIKIVRAKRPVHVIVPCADSIDPDYLENMAREKGESILLVKGETWETLSACDFLICKSGTSTLQAAIYNTPMILVYKADWFSYFLVKILSHVKWAGLPNLIANKEIVPELLQGKVTPGNIARLVLDYLQDESKRVEMKKELTLVRESLGEKGTAGRAADAICDYLRDLKYHNAK
jgi:lipid-A-disaccharide synthase